MTTARAKLHADLVDLLAAKNKAEAEERLRELIGSYRVQYKKPPAEKGGTAREALLDSLVEMLRRPPKDALGHAAALLDDYRMQIKGAPRAKSASSGSRTDGKRGRKATTKDAAAGAAPPVAAPDAAAAGTTSALPVNPEPTGPSLTPVAGGPPKAKRSTRAECPKCHSMGVVLARSYAADEYYSCIYCGWQGFKAPEALESQDSLAARLLGLYNSASSEEGEG